MKLRVIQPFGGHAVGDEITGQEAISAVLKSAQAAYVVKVAGASAADKTPEPQAPAQ